MEVFTLFEKLEALIEEGSKVPFSSKVMVDSEEIRETLEELRLKLPDELKQAKWVKEERQRIMADAESQAENLMKEAENKIIAMVDEHVITKQALDQKEEILQNANKLSQEISVGTKEYADSVLGRLEDVLKETLQIVHDNRKELK